MYIHSAQPLGGENWCAQFCKKILKNYTEIQKLKKDNNYTKIITVYHLVLNRNKNEKEAEEETYSLSV